MSTIKFKPFRCLAFTILVCYLITGIFIYKDFGLSWDEEAQMKTNGYATYDFITSLNSEEYITNSEKYHGPALEVVIVGLQKLFNITDEPDVYFFRHIVLFLLYWITGVIFYVLLTKLFKNNFVIIIGLLWYILTPRFFAESFYNTKDIGLYCLTIIAVYTFYRLQLKFTFTNILLHAIVCGFAIGIRITAIVIPALTFAILVYNSLQTFAIKKETISIFMKLLSFTLLTVVFTILFWPILWLDPIYHFIAAFKEMESYHWVSNVRYMNNFYLSNALPWHYTIVWILITTPELFIIFMLVGLFTFLINFDFKNRHLHPNTSTYLFLALFMMGTILPVIILKSVLYDSWRHLYFLHAGILIFSISGLDKLITYSSLKSKSLLIAAQIAVVSYTIHLGIKIKNMHPYQNVYFSTISGINNENYRFYYETDYWGLSYREAIEKLLRKTNSDSIKINFQNLAGELNLNIINKKDKTRIIISDLNSAEYFITNYRWCDREFNEYTRIDSIKVSNLIINGTYKIENKGNLD